MDWQGETVQDAVVVPVDNHVVGVHIASWPHIIPRVDDGEVAPPCIPGCQHQRIIRTPDSVVVVEVEARMTVYPRTVPFSRVEETAVESYMKTLEEDDVVPTPEAYAKGLKALT